MEVIRRANACVCQFYSDVIRWRSVFTVPYVMAINFVFCLLTFRADSATQEHTLYGLISVVVFTDLFFSSTHDHSVLYAIVSWPIQDFFKTFCVTLSSLAAYKLKQGDNFEAFVSSAVAVAALVVEPVYHYHDVNAKIGASFHRLGSSVKRFLTYLIVRPLLIAYDWTKYILLCRWAPLLADYLRNRTAAVFALLDRNAWQPLCAKCRRAAEIARYWLCLHWCADLARWARRLFLLPLVERLSRALDAVIYVIGCYWLRPVLNEIGRQTVKACAAAGRAAWHGSALVVTHVALPLLAFALAQLRLALLAIVRPLADRCQERYRYVEDLAYIYVLGVVFKRLVDSVPERNPFAVEVSDSELAEFMPNVSADEQESDCETDTLSRMSPQMTTDDEGDFLPRGLHGVDVCGSESSENEFTLRPRTVRRSHRIKKNRLSTLSALSFASISVPE